MGDLSERQLLMLKECECCHKHKRDVQPRRAHVSTPARLFCDGCWTDPAPTMQECGHGVKGVDASRFSGDDRPGLGGR